MFSFLALTKSKSFPYSSLQERWGGQGQVGSSSLAPTVHSQHSEQNDHLVTSVKIHRV